MTGGRLRTSVVEDPKGPDVAEGGDDINADAAVMATTLAKGQELKLILAPGRAAYLVPARGSATVNGQPLGERDGAAIEGEREVTIVANDEAELVLVEVAA